jgi:membrane-associated protease RseP (regulator of RpoE activity)
MKTKHVVLILAVILLCPISAIYAGSSSSPQQPQIGILLDTEPLPELLTKHLGLSPEQGIRIQNVRADSPADKAGLERDDIIIGLEGNEVKYYDELANKIRQTEAGNELSLEVIHLGQRKKIVIKPEILEGEVIWKYPPEPHTIQSWRPGKLFHLNPNDEDWLEVLPNNIPDIQLKELFKETYTYQYSKGGEDYSITIEGNPNDKDAEITVRAGKTEHKTTIEEMDKLPQKYYDSAKNALEQARETSKQQTSERKLHVPSPPTPETWRHFFDQEIPNRFRIQPINPDNKMLEKMEEQMRQLQERIEQLEKQQKQKHEQSPEKSDKQQPEEQETQLLERV